MANRFSKAVSKINKSPAFMRSFLLTTLFSSQVKYAKTSKIKLVKVSRNRTELFLENKKKVQNHIGGVHAVAAALLAESATGIVFGMNVKDSCVPLLKSMTIHYQRRMEGSLTGVARLTDEQIKHIESEGKGEMQVEVEITDESGQQPIVCEMLWAWVTKRAK